ncbi:ribosomal protein S5 family protein, partial [Tanacetum coccineum]
GKTKGERSEKKSRFGYSYDEDYMRVGPLIAKLEKENQKHVDPRILNMREEATDSESEEDDHRFTHEAIKERQEVLRKKLRRRDELLQNYTKSAGSTKVTKGGRMVKFSVMVVCGNYHGVIGFAKAKDENISKACHKVYLWPGPTQGGMKASNTVQTILKLAGLKNVKSKIVGARQAHNTVKAVFQGLNAVSIDGTCKYRVGRRVGLALVTRQSG